MKKYHCLGERLILILLLSITTHIISFAQENESKLAERYIKAYPDFFVAYKNGNLITKAGGTILFNDGRLKNYMQMITDPSVGDKDFDPEDAFYWNYLAGSELPTADNPPAGDPGRIRPAAIFQYMYGSTSAERSKKMRTIRWFRSADGRIDALQITTVNGVDKELEQIADELRNLTDEKKSILNGIVFNVGGFSGYNDRAVRGYPLRTSAHAYGIAVDVNWDTSYFSGAHQGKLYRYRNNLPKFLIDIFEKHKFIWGGRWYHYDAMHFEYRPEFFVE